MQVLHVVETNEFGDNFEFVEGKWRVRFPPQSEATYVLSGDENNAVGLDEEETIQLDKTKLYAYIMVQDDEQAKVFLYRYPAGTVFDRATATEVGAADMVELNALVDDIAITDAIIEFHDVHSETSLVFDTNMFQRVDSLVPGAGIDFNNSAGSGSNSLELELTLHCSESGGGFIITDDETEELVLSLWGYYYDSGALADLATRMLSSGYYDKLEFYDVGVPTQMVDDTFAVRGSIGIRNTSTKPLDLTITVYDSSYWNEISRIHSTAGNDTIDYRFVDDQHIVKVTLAPGQSISDAISVRIVDDPNNKLGTREGGLYVDPNSLGGAPVLRQHATAREELDAPINEGRVFHTLARHIMDEYPLEIPLTTLVNSRGKALGSIIKTLDGKIESTPVEET